MKPPSTSAETACQPGTGEQVLAALPPPTPQVLVATPQTQTSPASPGSAVSGGPAEAASVGPVGDLGADRVAGPSAPTALTGPQDFARLANVNRLDEDYRSLRGKPRAGFPLALKERRIAPNLWLSIGGDYRLRFDSYANPGFGRPSSTSYVALENRFLLHANLDIGDTIRAFVQFGAATEGGRRPRALPGERSGPDLVQGFVEIRPAFAFGSARVRAGRQEFVPGGKLFASREAINFRQAFDGVRLDAATAGWKLIAFAGRPVVNRTGSFDDATSTTDRVATVSLDHALISSLHLQAIFAARRNQRANYAQGAGSELRRSYSLRLFGSSGPVAVEAQGIYQNGSFSGTDGRTADISAWAAALQLELDLKGRLSPRFGIRVDGGSGDKDRDDGRLGTLDIPYPGLNYLNDATIFAPRNSRDLQPYLTIKPHPTVIFTVGDQLLWRNRRGDAVYGPANTAIVAPGTAGSLIANQPYLRGEWRASPLLSFQFSYVHATHGAVLRNAGLTKNLDYLAGSALFRF